jgi:alkaline phosphatase D
LPALPEQIAAPAISASASAAAGADPFVLGVAAGDLTADGFVLWTRLAPDPLSSSPKAPGGMLAGDVTVSYEIGADPQLPGAAGLGA